MEKVKNKDLFQEIRKVILDARQYVSKRVNFAQVVSNWEIGRMIVEEEQKGEYTAEYGKQLINEVSIKLSKEFGNGYSSTNLWYFRQFFLKFSIPHSMSGELQNSETENVTIQNAVHTKSNFPIIHAVSDQLPINLKQSINQESHPLFKIINPNLSWTHYRILLKVESKAAIEYYINETAENNWSTRALERQVNSLYYERIMSSQDKTAVKNEALQKIKDLKPEDLLKDPYVLEFLDIKKDTKYLESELEEALISRINEFLLELGKGFAFVARQKRIPTETKNYYVDLVFYNYLLKCFVLFDLKVGELTHKDIGQMDFYVRYFEDNIKADNDNPTIGVLLCTYKDETLIKYSVLNDSKQLFASKYKLYLPTEKELINEIEQSKLNYKLNK